MGYLRPLVGFRRLGEEEESCGQDQKHRNNQSLKVGHDEKHQRRLSNGNARGEVVLLEGEKRKQGSRKREVLNWR